MTTLRTKTITYPLEARTTSLATNTTLATATRYDTATITLDLPETGSRTILCAVIVWSFRANWAATNEVTGWRTGAKFNAAATVDLDRSFAQTGALNLFELLRHDVTANAIANLGSGATFDLVASLAVSTTTAATLDGNICAHLELTYQYDDDVGTTRLACVAIEVASSANSITAAQVEIGSDGTTPAPANQIPALDTFLPEAGKSIKRVWAELEYIDAVAGAGNSYTTYVQIDGATEMQRAFVPKTLANCVRARDLVFIDTAVYTTSTAHALKIRADVAARAMGMSATIWVVYTFDKSSTTTVMCMAESNLLEAARDSFGGFYHFSSNTTDQVPLWAEFNIQETNPVLKQSAAVVEYMGSNTMPTLGISAGAQVERLYITLAAAQVRPLRHRGDHSSGWPALARGRNRLRVRIRMTAQPTGAMLRGFVRLLYTADVPAQGAEARTRVVSFLHCQYGTSALGLAEVAAGSQYTPTLDAGWARNGSFYLDAWWRLSGPANSPYFQLQCQAGEFDGEGVVTTIWDGASRGPGAMAGWHTIAALNGYTNSNALQTGKLSPTTARRLGIMNAANALTQVSSRWSYHAIAFTVAGLLRIDGSAAGAGKAIRVWALDANGVAELVNTGATDASGLFTIAVPDSTRTYFATHQNGSDNGASLAGAPGSGFLIAVRAGASETPDVEITGFPATTTTATTASIAFTCSVGSAEASVDGGAYADVTSPIALTGLALGAHTVAIRAKSGTTHQQTFAWSVVAASSGGGSPALGIETTPAAIRDRMLALITALVPATLSGDPFIAYRNEGGGDLEAWALKNPVACRRRVQVRRIVDRDPAEVTNGDSEELRCTFRVRVAYPQTWRDGATASKANLDRDDVIDQDMYAIDQAIGATARGNFAPPYPDACWRTEGNGETSRIGAVLELAGVDIAEIFVSYSYLRRRV